MKYFNELGIITDVKEFMDSHINHDGTYNIVHIIRELICDDCEETLENVFGYNNTKKGFAGCIFFEFDDYWIGEYNVPVVKIQQLDVHGWGIDVRGHNFPLKDVNFILSEMLYHIEYTDFNTDYYSLKKNILKILMWYNETLYDQVRET